MDSSLSPVAGQDEVLWQVQVKGEQVVMLAVVYVPLFLLKMRQNKGCNESDKIKLPVSSEDN